MRCPYFTTNMPINLYYKEAEKQKKKKLRIFSVQLVIRSHIMLKSNLRPFREQTVKDCWCRLRCTFPNLDLCRLCYLLFVYILTINYYNTSWVISIVVHFIYVNCILIAYWSWECIPNTFWCMWLLFYASWLDTATLKNRLTLFLHSCSFINLKTM